MRIFNWKLFFVLWLVFYLLVSAYLILFCIELLGMDIGGVYCEPFGKETSRWITSVTRSQGNRLLITGIPALITSLLAKVFQKTRVQVV